MSAKKEARIERRLAKRLKHQEKRARLVERVAIELEPRVEMAVPALSGPRASERPESIMQMRMEYEIHTSSDRKGEWSWGQARDWCDESHGPENACTVRATMIEMSGLYWHEILSQTTGGNDRHRKHHPQSWDSLCDEAQSRWLEIERDEEELFRFRTSNKQRIWGYRQGAKFFVVWWDAEHKIYPVEVN